MNNNLNKDDIDKEVSDDNDDNGVSDNLKRSDDIDLHEENNGA